MSFNGGKDCTVVLHLLAQISDTRLTDIHFVHFTQPNEFDEVTAFRKEIEEQFNINIHLFGANFKSEV